MLCVLGTTLNEKGMITHVEAAAAAAAEWLPGASAEHLTAGGLRIGKPHPEGEHSRTYLYISVHICMMIHSIAPHVEAVGVAQCM
jgi:hypothetical protein